MGGRRLQYNAILYDINMKKLLLLLALCAPTLMGAKAQEDFSPVDYVNPLVGTQSSFALSTGNTYPAIARPWGMNFWTPQTGKMGDGWVYTYDAHKIRGIKQTHQPSPWINDYGQFALMATTGKTVFDQEERASWFSHKAEVATPYYYSVYLADYDVLAEITPTERAAVLRFTYPENNTSAIVLDALDQGSYVQVLPKLRKVIGYSTKNSGGVPKNFRNYFVLQLDKEVQSVTLVQDSIQRTYTAAEWASLPALEAKGNHTGVILTFGTHRSEVVTARVASSFISTEQAWTNLAEVGERPFEEVKAEGKKQWNATLGRIRVHDNHPDNLRTFYSCLYRSVLFPRDLSEVSASGQRLHYSPYSGEVKPGYMFTDTGFWDTFRSLFPLLHLVYPSMGVKMQEGLVNTFLESGFLPEWASPGHRGCMVGNNSAAVVADALAKGLKGYDAEKLWDAVTHGAHAVHPEVSSTGRLGWQYYDSLGYVPCDKGINESAARTLEYAYNDWCIYRIGTLLGKPKEVLTPYARSAYNYKNLFDPEHRLMRGRQANGAFQSPFNPFKWGDAFTEGNSWHYTWSVFHDPQGLINLMGGKAQFCAMLDSVFALPPLFDDSYYGQVIHEIREMQVMNMGNYAHGNQPIQHMIYLYNYAGEPWKAQKHVRNVMLKLYNANPDGYCGDEDNGQTSAWYVFSALGFYPVCPGGEQFVVGSPLFQKVTLSLENGRTVTLQAPHNAPNSPYIQSMSLNGSPYTRTFLQHADLIQGATITYHMSNKPNYQRGTAPADAPYSFSSQRQ